MPQGLADLVIKFCREWAFTHARRVRLRNTDNAVDAGRANTGASQRTAGGRVRRGHERVRAMVDVEHGGLTTFKKHRVATIERLIHFERRIADHRADAIGVCEQFFSDGVRVEGFHADGCENLIFRSESCLDLLAQCLRVEQILNANADAVHLVRVGRADATAGCADLVLPASALVRLVHQTVVAGDDVSIGGNLQARAVNATRFHFGQFLEQNINVDDDAVADDRGNTLG